MNNYFPNKLEIVVFALLISCMLYYLYRKLTRKKRLKNGAKEINDLFKSISNYKSELILADPVLFSYLDLNYYNETQKFLESRGFKYVSDDEDTKASNMAMYFKRTFSRSMVSPDGAIVAVIYHLKPNLLPRILLRLPQHKIIDFATEFSDGTFICTSNAELADSLKSPPQIRSKFFTASIPLLEILNYHINSITAYSKENTSISPIIVESRMDIHKSVSRYEHIKNSSRKKMGMTSEEELAKFCVDQPELAAEVKNELDKIKNNDYVQ